MFYFILLIFFIIVLIFIKNKMMVYEPYNVYMDSIKFLNKEDGCDLLKSVDTYFNNMTESDLRARDLSRKSNILDFYCSNVMIFKQDEKLAIAWLIKIMNERLPDEYRFLMKSWKFCKIDKVLENNYPHTHKNCIFLSNDFVNSVVNMFKKKKEKDAIELFGSTIIHEKIHVWQREEKEKFNELYTKYWNFQYKKVEDSDEIVELLRNNPDGNDFYWIFNTGTKYIWICCRYNTTMKNFKLNNVNNLGIYVKKLGDKFVLENPIKSEELRYLDEFINYFDIYHNNYHPNEISAEIISKYYLHLMRVKRIELNTPALKQFIKWKSSYKK